MMKSNAPKVTLDYDGFSKLIHYFGKHRNKIRLDQRIDAAWLTMLDHDATDQAVIGAALDAARHVKKRSSDDIGMDAEHADAQLLPAQVPTARSKPKKSRLAKKSR